jgi:hypothetical protein
MPIVRLPHLTKLFNVAPERITLGTGETVLVDNALDSGNSIVQVTLIEFAAPPIAGKFAELLSCFV